MPREPYCVSLFRLGVDGQFDSNILIRSLLLRGQRLRAHAGCGIVADSDPEELGWKLQPLRRPWRESSPAHGRRDCLAGGWLGAWLLG